MTTTPAGISKCFGTRIASPRLKLIQQNGVDDAGEREDRYRGQKQIEHRRFIAAAADRPNSRYFISKSLRVD